MSSRTPRSLGPQTHRGLLLCKPGITTFASVDRAIATLIRTRRAVVTGGVLTSVITVRDPYAVYSAYSESDRLWRDLLWGLYPTGPDLRSRREAVTRHVRSDRAASAAAPVHGLGQSWAGIPFTWNSIPLPADEQRWGGGGVPTIRWPWGEDWYYFWDQGPRPAWQLLGLMVSLKLSAEMRDEVLRFLNKVLEIQCLVRLLARCAVSRCLFVRSLILILLAVAHCFGLRSESDDHGLPAVSKSSRRGALALA